MKNFEKYKEAEKRADKFAEFCDKQHCCDVCKFKDINKGRTSNCAFVWLELEAEEEKPMPCPFCGGEVQYCEVHGNVWFHCSKCKYNSGEFDREQRAVAAHNRICRAVNAAEEGARHEAN